MWKASGWRERAKHARGCRSECQHPRMQRHSWKSAELQQTLPMLPLPAPAPPRPWSGRSTSIRIRRNSVRWTLCWRNMLEQSSSDLGAPWCFHARCARLLDCSWKSTSDQKIPKANSIEKCCVSLLHIYHHLSSSMIIYAVCANGERFSLPHVCTSGLPCTNASARSMGTGAQLKAMHLRCIPVPGFVFFIWCQTCSAINLNFMSKKWSSFFMTAFFFFNI